MKNFFSLDNDYILEDSSDFFYPSTNVYATFQTSSFVNMLKCSNEVQPSAASFIASKQLQTEANPHDPPE